MPCTVSKKSIKAGLIFHFGGLVSWKSSDYCVFISSALHNQSLALI